MLRPLLPQIYVHPPSPHPYSHSTVAGGFDVMSYTTRLTDATVLQILEDTDAKNFGSNWNLHQGE
jgi:hypothetical protein